LIGIMHGPQGGSSKIIDEYYKQYEDYEEEFPGQQRAQKLFNKVLTKIKELLPEIKLTRWGNKTDFYTLFTTLASLLRMGELPSSKVKDVRKALDKFEQEINMRLANEDAQVGKPAIDYVRAVEKGANDKKRRADRQAALIEVIGKHFKQKQKTA